MAKKTIEQVDVSGKRVLMRVDFNVPIGDDGSIGDDRRIVLSLPGIKSVLSRGGSVVLMSHLGRPDGTGFEAAYSLAPVAERLRELLGGTTVHFPSQDCLDDTAANAVADLKAGEVLLLENLRFHKAEKTGDAAFAERLAGYGDLYCNDAFGTAHRADASMVAVPTAMAGKPRVSGPLVATELRFLSEAINDPKKPTVAILGGAKISDKIGAIENMLRRFDVVLVGGAMAYTFLKALGRNVGDSRVEESMIPVAKKIIDLAARSASRKVLPMDHVCAREPVQGTPIEVVGDSIPDGWMGLDIGPKTVGRFTQEIANAGTIMWNGPMGMFEVEPFDSGTRQVAEAMAEATKRGAITVVGGGDTAAAVARFGLGDAYSHVSTGGGASIEMLEGKPFKSIDLLDEA